MRGLPYGLSSSFTAGAWQQVPGPWDDGDRISAIAPVGDDIREEAPIRCTVTESGKGFLISDTGVQRVGP